MELVEAKSCQCRPAVQVKNLSYTYPIEDFPALIDLSLTIAPGEFVAIIGENGSGKSSLCYALSGFIPHFFKGNVTGSIEVNGVHVLTSSLSELVQTVGLVFQNPLNQISGMKFTVRDEIAFGLENLGICQTEMDQIIRKVMVQTGIENLSERSPFELSGGQQQRLAIASILAMSPDILILDEPTSQLDPTGSWEIFSVIRDLCDQGITVIMAEHKIEAISEFADRVIVMQKGAIAMDGSPNDVLASPLLLENHLDITRFTLSAEKAQKIMLWPENRKLPVTINDAVQGFNHIRKKRAT